MHKDLMLKNTVYGMNIFKLWFKFQNATYMNTVNDLVNQYGWSDFAIEVTVLKSKSKQQNAKHS